MQQLSNITLGFGRVLIGVVQLARSEKKYWLLPLLLMLIVVGALFAFAVSTGPLAPFLYTFW